MEKVLLAKITLQGAFKIFKDLMRILPCWNLNKFFVGSCKIIEEILETVRILCTNSCKNLEDLWGLKLKNLKDLHEDFGRFLIEAFSPGISFTLS